MELGGAGETVSLFFEDDLRQEFFQLLPSNELSQVVWFAPSEMMRLIRDSKSIETSRGIDDYYMQLDVYIFDCNRRHILRCKRSIDYYIVLFCLNHHYL